MLPSIWQPWKLNHIIHRTGALWVSYSSWPKCLGPIFKWSNVQVGRLFSPWPLCWETASISTYWYCFPQVVLFCFVVQAVLVSQFILCVSTPSCSAAAFKAHIMTRLRGDTVVSSVFLCGGMQTWSWAATSSPGSNYTCVVLPLSVVVLYLRPLLLHQ